jgi:hypothetical protein
VSYFDVDLGRIIPLFVEGPNSTFLDRSKLPTGGLSLRPMIKSLVRKYFKLIKLLIALWVVGWSKCYRDLGEYDAYHPDLIVSSL